MKYRDLRNGMFFYQGNYYTKTPEGAFRCATGACRSFAGDTDVEPMSIIDGRISLGTAARDVENSSQRYRVLTCGEHGTLCVGDAVHVVYLPGGIGRLIFRPSDWTLHALMDRHGNLVMLEECNT